MRILFAAVFFLHSTTALFSQKMPVPDIVDKVISGVVTVAIYQSDVVLKPMGFRGSPSDLAYSKVLDLSGAQGSGSGFIIKENNKYYIITNAHVVQNATQDEGSIYIYTVNSSKYEAMLIGGDSFYDLAVLEFRTQPGNEISAVNFRTTDIRVGEPVYAIGNPLGDYPYTVSDGIISAKNRIRGGMTGRFGFLQSTATVIWGNSGGPLVDASGEVVGINSQIAFTQMDGNAMWLPHINFALEAAICRRLVNDIINNNGLVKRAYIGVEVNKESLVESKGSYYKSMNDQAAVNQLVTISNVITGSPADGILNKYIGYKIDAVNDAPVKSVQDVLGVFETVRPGETVSFTLSQKDQPVNVKVKASQASASANSDIGKLTLNKMGCNTLPSEDNTLSISFNKSGFSSYGNNSSGDAFELENKTKISSAVLFGNEWMVIGGGVYAESNSQIWTIKDLTDMGTVLRLCGENGFVDLILLRKGSDPKVASNYVAKRFIFSGANYIRRQSLWY